ncbi:MAG: FAD-dependent thymidylate synthase, partial [Lachnoclostridium sp.]|nr:FAD-dependent thymidylate synthase [Lachnoclostridium sp.]
MKSIKPYVEIIAMNDYENILRKLETIGRVCYKSESKMTDESAERFIKNILKRGHESVIEHESITVRIVCDRGVSHEIVRHRIASYSQESTRYCNYTDDKFDNQITVIDLAGGFHYNLNDDKDKLLYEVWQEAMKAAEQS